jgi:excisionase family DNA binding protein
VVSAKRSKSVQPKLAATLPKKRPLRRREPLIPLTKTIDDTCRMTGLGRTKIYELIAEGKLKATTVGRRRLVFYASIEALLRGQGT